MRIEQDLKLDYSDVLIRPKRSTLGSRKEVDLERGYWFRNYTPEDMSIEMLKPDRKHWRGIPIMAANMDGVGTFEMADKLAQLRLFTCLVKTYSVNELVSFYDTSDSELKERRRNHVAYSMGITDADHEKWRMVYEQADSIKFVCIDVANGYSERFVDFVRQFRELYPHTVIIAGNVVTGEMTEQLILNGADIVKVGIGPGSVCTTRIVTGVGYPQLSALVECADAAHGLGGHIIADGGCTCPGDVAKAFAGGADYVMLGGMFAGHDEGGGDVITRYFRSNEVLPETDDGLGGEIPTRQLHVPVIEEKKFVQFYGMSSDAANKKHFGGLKDYRSSEGREVLIDYKGQVADTVQHILGGLRSACTYAGAVRLKHLPRCATFVRVTNQFNAVFAK